MASFPQVMNMGPGTPTMQPPAPPTPRGATPTGGPPPMLGQAMNAMNPGQPMMGGPMGPGGPMEQPPDPMDLLARQLEGPEIANLVGPQGMPSMSLLDLMRLLQMQHSWNDASAPYGPIL